MKLRNLRLTLANVARTTNAKTLEVIETSTIRSRNADGTYSDDTTGYSLDCSAYKGDTIKVKFPKEVECKVEEVKKLLSQDKCVEVSFTGLKLTPYAMQTANGLLSGVSAKADDFEIVSALGNDLDIIDFDVEP